MGSILKTLYHNKVFERFFPTTVYLLQRELEGCDTVLDIGCGPDSPLQYCKNISYSVGVEPYKPYFITAKRKKIHTKYINKSVENLNFPEKSFDAVVMIEVLEHLTKGGGKDILGKVNQWASKKIVITTPNGFIPQRSLDRNILQRHLSGWDPRDLEQRGFSCRGLAGFKFLRFGSDKKTMGEDLTVSIRFRPRFFWFAVAGFTQSFAYFFPRVAFELFCVKDLRKGEV